MSIKVMTNVWEKSNQEGTRLLLLLALADYASDDGVCWPGVPTLGYKVRRSERHARRLLRQLEDRGEIWTLYRGGRHLSNYYLVTVGFNEEELEKTLIARFGLEPDEAKIEAQGILEKRAKVEKEDTGVTEEKGGHPCPKRGTSLSEKGDIIVSPEPSLTVIEPSPVSISPDGDENPLPESDEQNWAQWIEEEEQLEQEHGWRKPQTVIEADALYAVGRRHYDDETERQGMLEIVKKVQSYELPEKYWKNRLWCARQYGWSLRKLISSTLNPENLERWQQKQNGASE